MWRTEYCVDGVDGEDEGCEGEDEEMHFMCRKMETGFWKCSWRDMEMGFLEGCLLFGSAMLGVDVDKCCKEPCSYVHELFLFVSSIISITCGSGQCGGDRSGRGGREVNELFID